MLWSPPNQQTVLLFAAIFQQKKMRIFPLPGRVGSPFRSNLQFCSLNQLEIHLCCTIFIHFLRDFPPVNLEIWKSTILRSFSEGKLSNFISVLVIDGSINLIISWLFEVNLFEANPHWRTWEVAPAFEVLPRCLRASCDPGSQQGDTSTGQGIVGLDKKKWGLWVDNQPTN